MRYRSEPLTRRAPRGFRTRVFRAGACGCGLVFSTSLTLAACRAPEPDRTLQPDSLLRAELGLTLEDRVHRVRISGGEAEAANPRVTSIEPGAYVEFMTADWLVHEVFFEKDSLSAEQWAFLERTDQVASPPLVDRESRYVLAFEGAPPGRYPYRLEGNGRPGGGEILLVVPEPAR